MFTNHEILEDQEAVLDALSEFNFNECVIGPMFTNCIFKAWNISKEKCALHRLIAACLLHEFKAIETNKGNGLWEMYSHDAAGEKHLLLVKCY